MVEVKYMNSFLQGKLDYARTVVCEMHIIWIAVGVYQPLRHSLIRDRGKHHIAAETAQSKRENGTYIAGTDACLVRR